MNSVENFTGISRATAGTRSYDISTSISSSTLIRFRVNNSYKGWNETFLVDDVQIQFEVVVASIPNVVGQAQAEAAIVNAGLTISTIANRTVAAS